MRCNLWKVARRAFDKFVGFSKASQPLPTMLALNFIHPASSSIWPRLCICSALPVWGLLCACTCLVLSLLHTQLRTPNEVGVNINWDAFCKGRSSIFRWKRLSPNNISLCAPFITNPINTPRNSWCVRNKMMVGIWPNSPGMQVWLARLMCTFVL